MSSITSSLLRLKPSQKCHSTLEIILPRRKIYLLKLLVLIPLTTLLVTSIYYQFYYQTPNQNLPIASPQAAFLFDPDKNSQDVFSVVDNQNLSNSLGIDYTSNNNENLQQKQQADDENQLSSSVELRNNSYRSKIKSSHDGYIDSDNFKTNYKQQANSQEEDFNNLAQLSDNQQIISNDNIDDDIEKQQQIRNHQAKHTESSTSTNQVKQSLIIRRLLQNQKRAKISDINDNYNNESQLNQVLRDEEQQDAQSIAVIPAPSESTGLGELGRPVILKNLTSEQQNFVNVGWQNNAFNQYISDLISVNRSLPDVRDPSCKLVDYPDNLLLPQTSIIICFHNEAWSVLLRTVHSAINRSSKGLIKEIILVDDFSSKPHLGQQLEDYMRNLEIVKIVRATKREGLIRARLLGAKAATAPVLTFLDSHCECADGWLEPLLTRIYQDSTTVVCPVIDVISDKTFEYHYKGDAASVSVGGFDWNLQFNWHSVPEREKKRRKHTHDPIRSPTMAGGLFSIDKNFFEKLGTYDSGFDIWGGENLELSFKTWMCGGTLEIVPCSHVGHVFRSRSPYKWRTGVNVLRRNSVRLAEVWMDDYKKYYYDRIGHELGDFGDIHERVELRQKLKCKPFSYYVKNVYPELFIPGEAVAYGEIRNEAGGQLKMCLDSPARKSDFHKPLGVYPCHGSGGNQYWLLSRDGEIRRDEACVDYAGHDVVLFPCHGSGGNQLWYFDKDTNQIRHSTSGQCLELARDKIRVKMSDCDPSLDVQRWIFQHFNASLAITEQ